MSTTENSALIALSELRNLEANRVAEVENAKRAKEEAERKAREEAERIAREEAERRAREEAERIARETAEREAREREERLRLQEAELRARAEQESRLQEERMRLDAQVRLAEKSARPMWLYAVVGGLFLVVSIGGYLAYDNDQRTKADKAAAEFAQEQERKKRDADFAALASELKGLQEEQNRIRKQKEEIENQLKNVKDDSEKQRLLAQQAALEQQLAAGDDRIRKNKGKKTDDPKAEKSKGGITVKKNVDDPLDGL